MEKMSTNFQFKAKKVSKKRLQRIWNTLTNKPFPFGKLRAYILPNDEADRVFEMAKKSPNIRNRSAEEYGEYLDLDDKTDAVITVETHSDGKKGWIILIKKDGHYTVDENLRHELEHIAKGEIRLDGSSFGNK